MVVYGIAKEQSIDHGMDGSTTHLMIEPIFDGWSDTGKYPPLFKDRKEAEMYIENMDKYERPFHYIIELSLYE